MKAVYITEHGGADKLVYGDRPEREIAPGEVMLRVRASALNHLDLNLREGKSYNGSLPRTLGCDIAFLAANPDHRQKLVDDPSLVPAAVEELLRWETPVTGVPRKLKQDVSVGGLELKKGEIVTLLLGAANLDGSQFDEADVARFERERNRHLAFGGGPHRCLGSHLARMELRVALEEWHRRIPDYEIKAGETPIYSPGIREVQYLPLVWSPRP